MRFLFVLAAVCTLLSCLPSVGPRDLLVGTWSKPQVGIDGASVTATPTGATLNIPCIGVVFGPIGLDDSLAFHVTGVVTQAGGLVTVRVGDPWVISGRVVAGDLLLGSDTLVPGTVRLICNA